MNAFSSRSFKRWPSCRFQSIPKTIGFSYSGIDEWGLLPISNSGKTVTADQDSMPVLKAAANAKPLHESRKSSCNG